MGKGANLYLSVTQYCENYPKTDVPSLGNFKYGIVPPPPPPIKFNELAFTLAFY
jgi:hypothetical protein